MVRPAPSSEEEALTKIVRRADLPYFRVDAHRKVVEMGPAFERLTGFDAREIVGGSCLEVHRCVECLKGCGVFDQGLVTDKELELHRADGSTVRVRKSGRVFRDADGRITGALEIVEPVDVEPVDAWGGEPEGVHAPPPARRVGEARDQTRAFASAEVARIQDALQRTRYNRTKAARLLGISRTTLWRKMREHGL